MKLKSIGVLMLLCSVTSSTGDDACKGEYQEENKTAVIKFTCPYDDKVILYEIEDSYGRNNTFEPIRSKFVSGSNDVVLKRKESQHGLNDSYTIRAGILQDISTFVISSDQFGRKRFSYQYHFGDEM